MNFSNNNSKRAKRSKERLAFTIFLILSSVFIFSCSEDEEAIIPQASDINVSLDENQVQQSSIGTITTNLTGTLNYTITSQSVDGALTVDSNTGEVFTNDLNTFDYEVNPIIEANISVTNSSQTANSTVTITLNDLDDIYSFLSSSKQSYFDAQNGDWVLITESEYNDLANKLYNVNTISTSNQQYDTEEPINYDSINYTYCNNNSVDIAPSHFIFAVKYKGNEDNVTEAKIKISNTSVSDGFTDLGSVLPEHNAGDNHFVLKGNNINSDSNSYLGIYGELAYVNVADFNFKFKSGDSEELTFDWTGIALYQGLSTDTKQWD